MAPMRLIFCVWGVALLSAVEQSVVAPSMWLYLRDLGGSQSVYSVALAAFLVGRVLALPVVGLWSDRRPCGEILRSLVCLGLLASLLYSLASCTGSPWSAVAGRGFLGVASAVSVATTSFVARHTSQEDRTRYIGINSVLSNGMKICGPGLNVFFVLAPVWDPIGSSSSRSVALFGPLTDPGWFLALAHIAALLVLAVAFKDPPREDAGQQAGAKHRLGAREVCGHLWGSGAWVCWVTTAQNNFTYQAMVWALPILTDRELGWGELENSYLSGAMAVVGIGAALLISCAAGRLQDRHIIAWNQLLAGCGFIPLAVLGGCHAGGVSASPVAIIVAGALLWTVGFQGQVPGNMGLYSKLVGTGNFGFYQSLFMMVMTCSRMLCSCLIGLVQDLCPVWAVACALWMFQWVVLGSMWRRLQPAAYNAYHEARARNLADVSVTLVSRTSAPASA